MIIAGSPLQGYERNHIATVGIHICTINAIISVIYV